jgi:hypothetical protein
MTSWMHRGWQDGCSVSALCLLLLLGCDSPPTPAPGNDQKPAESAGHGHAAHHPANFSDGVRQLQGWSQSQRGAAERPTESKPPLTLEQVRDIVRWLPELAGDSALRRADWEQVQQIVARLEQLTAPWQSDSHVAAGLDEFDRLITELLPLVANSVDPVSGL